MLRLLSLAAWPLLIACGGPTGPGTPGGNGPAPQQLTSTYFQFTYPAADAESVRSIAAAADTGVPGIIAELGANEMPHVRVTYYQSQSAMADAVRPIVGSIPSFASGLVTSSRDIHLVVSTEVIARRTTTLLHEFAHCVSLHRNPSIANNPRWLWETLAIYAARDRSNAPRLAAALAGPQPTFPQLNSFDNTLIYDVGFSLGEFIVERGGIDALRALLISNGNTNAALGLSLDEFLAAWFTWARARAG